MTTPRESAAGAGGQQQPRRIGAAKLFEAGADIFTSAAQKTARALRDAPHVADRLIRREGDDDAAAAATGGATRQRLADLRISVATEAATGGDGGGAAAAATFRVTLADRRTNTHVAAVSGRTWEQFLQIHFLVRSVAPKLDVAPLPPPPPRGSDAGAAAVAAEDRRRYVQTYLAAAAANAAVAALRELQEFAGYGDYVRRLADADRHTEAGEAAVAASRAHLRHVVVAPTPAPAPPPAPPPPNTNASFASPRGSEATPSSPVSSRPVNTSLASAPAPPPAAAVAAESDAAAAAAAADTRPDAAVLEECFRLLDVGGAGYLMPDDVRPFFDVVGSGSARAQRAVAAATRDERTFSAAAFAATAASVAAASDVTVRELAHRYRRQHVFPAVFAAFAAHMSGDATAIAGDAFDVRELKVLAFVLRVSGLRLLAPSEVAAAASAATELALPLSKTDFGALLATLCAAVPADEILRALAKSGGSSSSGAFASRVALAVNRAAATAPASVAAALAALSRRFATGSSGAAEDGGERLGQCGNCEASERRVRGLRVRLAESEAECDALAARVEELMMLLQTAQEEQQQQQEEQQLLLSQQQKQQRVSPLSGRGGGGVADGAEPEASLRCSVVQLAPCGGPLGSSADAPVVDLPGPLVMALPLAAADFRPHALRLDILLVASETENNGDGDGTRPPRLEYLACRDADGRRSCAWTIDLDTGALTLPWVAADAACAVGSFFARFPALSLGHAAASSSRRRKGVGSQPQPLLMGLRLARGVWTRLQWRFDWAAQAMHLDVDGALAFEHVPMRDAVSSGGVLVAGVATLDVFPRVAAATCYANVRFVSPAGL